MHLRPSPYGGTAAVVLIPRELLAEAADQGPEPVAAAPASAPAPVGGKPAVRRGQRELVSVPALTEDGDGGHRHSAGAPVAGDQPVRSGPRPVGGPRPAVAEPARTPGGLPRRRAASGTGRHRRAGEEQAAAPRSQDAPAHAAPPAGGLLPRRVRQANLAPQLKPGTPEPPSDPARERSPEEARSTFASFQRGFTRGRGDRLQPASLTVVPDAPPPPTRPAPAAPESIKPRAALGSAPVPQALAAAPAPYELPAAPAVPPVPSAPNAPSAQPVSAEGTES